MNAAPQYALFGLLMVSLHDRTRAYLSDFGSVSSADAVKTLRPSGKVTEPPDALFEPSRARKPSTTTTSPGFRTCLLIPLRSRTPGGPPENAQFVTVPVSSFTSTKNQMCGFVHSILVTTPVTLTGLSLSYSAAN